MKALVGAATLVVGHFLINASPASAQERLGRLLTPHETRAYHACLSEAWIEDYCRANSGRWSPSYDRVFPACVIANGGGRFHLDGRDGWYNTDDYCWSAAQGLIR